jgi:hypothetical protein
LLKEATGMSTPDDRRIRFLSPLFRGGTLLLNPFKTPSTRKEKHPESEMKDVLVSGCTASEYSYDALIGGTYHGAMTYHALQIIRAMNYRITYKQLEAQLEHAVEAAGYPQHPQVEGKRRNQRRQIFT